MSLPEEAKSKKKFPLSDIFTVLLVIFGLLMVFSPTAKGLVMQGLMKIGLFQPSTENIEVPENLGELTAGIQFTDSENNLISLPSLKGKVVFVNFWATWCPPCRAEMPSIENLYQKFKDDKNIVFLMVDVDNNYQNAKKFMDNEGYTLPVYTPASVIPKELMSGTIPTTLIFDKEGHLVLKHEGAGNFGSKKIMNFLTDLSQNGR